MVDLD